MTNTFMTGAQIASVAANLAAQDLGLSRYVKRDVAADFHAGGSNVVQIRVPGVTTVSERAVGATTDYALGAIAEQFIPVTLSTEAYSAIPLTLADTTLEIESYSAQVLRPQALSVANHIDNAVATAMAATTADATITYDAANPRAAFVKARAVLRGRGVSADSPLTAIVGVDVFADLLNAEAIDDAGKVAGVLAAENSMVPPGAMFVLVPEAFVAAIRAPEVPSGLAIAASTAEAGMALTAYQSFDGRSGVTLSVLSAFVGVAPLPLAVPNFLTGEVDLVAGGGIVSVTTAA